MSLRVWKYRLHTAGLPTDISMPTGAEIVRFAKQNHEPFLWALVMPEPPVFETRRFIWGGTGDEFPEFAQYRGTCEEITYERIAPDGRLQERSFIWHLFELPRSA